MTLDGSALDPGAAFASGGEDFGNLFDELEEMDFAQLAYFSSSPVTTASTGSDSPEWIAPIRSSSSSPTTVPERPVATAVKRNRVVKSSRRSKPTAVKEVEHNGEIVLVSTRPRGFPSFDRSNILMHLPTLISKCQNTGDLRRLRDLVNLRANKDCMVVTPEVPEGLFGSEHIVRFYNAINQYYPDSVSYTTSLSSWGGEIRSSYVFKKTDCYLLKSYVDTAQGKLSTALNCCPRNYLDCMDLTKRTPEEIKELERLVTSKDTFTVHGSGVMKLYFDDNKKIKKFEIECRILDLVKVVEDDFHI